MLENIFVFLLKLIILIWLINYYIKKTLKVKDFLAIRRLIFKFISTLQFLKKTALFILPISTIKRLKIIPSLIIEQKKK